jgi:hypothetical protein
MNEKEIIIPIDPDILNIIHNCIVEHWRMLQFKEELSSDEFSVLETLREKILKLRDNSHAKEVRFSLNELEILTKAYEIGFTELTRDGDDFHPIVGHDIERGREVLNLLKSYL